MSIFPEPEPVWVFLKRQLILGTWVFLHFQFPPRCHFKDNVLPSTVSIFRIIIPFTLSFCTFIFTLSVLHFHFCTFVFSLSHFHTCTFNLSYIQFCTFIFTFSLLHFHTFNLTLSHFHTFIFTLSFSHFHSCTLTLSHFHFYTLMLGLYHFHAFTCTLTFSFLKLKLNSINFCKSFFVKIYKNWKCSKIVNKIEYHNPLLVLSWLAELLSWGNLEPFYGGR